MAVVTKTRTYATMDTLTAAYYNDDRDEIIAGVNSIVDAQVASNAAIVESKLLFSDGGHAHGGGTDGQKILAANINPVGLTPSYFLRVNAGGTGIETATIPNNSRGFAWFLSKVLVVENDPGINPVVPQAMTVKRLWGYVKVAPTGADVQVQIKNTLGTIIATLTIPAGQSNAYTDTIVTPALTQGWFLIMNVIQIGSSTAGQGLTVFLETEQLS